MSPLKRKKLNKIRLKLDKLDNSLIKLIKQRQEAKREGMFYDVDSINVLLEKTRGYQKELSTEDKKIDKELTRLENEKIDLVRQLYKTDEHYDIEELSNIHSSLVIKRDELKKQKNNI